MFAESFYVNDEVTTAIGADFSSRNPREVFSGLTVYVEFTEENTARRMATATVACEPGRWVLAYSSLARLHAAVGDDEVEYSAMRGKNLLTALPAGLGLWFDPDYPGGRQIVSPALEVCYQDVRP